MGKRILIIDNNTKSLRKLFHYLRFLEHELTYTDSAENALKILEKTDYDLIVTQSTLLDADITQLDDRLREINFTGKVLPVINDPLLKKALNDLYYVRYFIEDPYDLVTNEKLIKMLLQIAEIPQLEEHPEWWDASFHLKIPSISELIEKVIQFLIDKASPFLDNSRIRNAFQMATSEALANAIEHGNKFDVLKKVDIQMEVSHKRIEVTVQDEGSGYNYQNINHDLRNLNQEFQKRGRGLSIIRKYADEVEIKGNGNIITFTFQLQPEASSKNNKQSA